MQKKKLTACHNCGSPNTKAKDNFFLSVMRYLQGKKPRRKCLSCQHTFHSKWIIPQKVSVIFVLMISLGIGTVLYSKDIAMVPILKDGAVSLYKYIYADNHKHMLKKHWGWLYSSDETRTLDYQRHSK